MNQDQPLIYYQSTLPTLADGAQARGFRCSSRNELLVSTSLAGVATLGLADNANGVASSATANGQKVVARNTKHNGTSWDLDCKPSATARLVSAAASTNATNAKNAASDLYKVCGYNAAAAARYLKIYNKATAPTVGTDTPVLTLALAPSAAFNFDFGGLYFSAGIGFAITVNAADADTAAVTAADIVGLNLIFTA